MASRPWMKMYPGDWRRDAGVQSCSLAARGLWHELLMVMHECDTYGVLRIGGKVPDSARIAKLVGSKPKDVERLLVELEEANVFSRAEDGAIFNRRMVKDERMRLEAVANGSMGGNPSLRSRSQGDNPSQSEGDNPFEQDRDNPSPRARTRARADSDSDSDSSGSSPSTEQGPESSKHLETDSPRGGEGAGSGTPPPKPAGRKRSSAKIDPETLDLGPLLAGTELDTPECRDALRAWLRHKRLRGDGYVETGVQALISRLSAWGSAGAIEAIQTSMANNWAGLFQPDQVRSGRPVEPKGFAGIREYLARTGGGHEQRA